MGSADSQCGPLLSPQRHAMDSLPSDVLLHVLRFADTATLSAYRASSQRSVALVDRRVERMVERDRWIADDLPPYAVRLAACALMRACLAFDDRRPALRQLARLFVKRNRPDALRCCLERPYDVDSVTFRDLLGMSPQGVLHIIDAWGSSCLRRGDYDSPRQALRACIRDGQIDAIRVLVNVGTPVSVADLTWAVRLARPDIASLLAAHGIEIARSEHSRDLIDNCTLGHDDIVEMLLAQGADAAAHDSLALYWAGKQGHSRILRMLIEHGADPSSMDSRTLVAASSNGHLEAVRVLLDNGADVHAGDDAALIVACRLGHHAVVALLLQRNARVGARDSLALMEACGHGRRRHGDHAFVTIVELLIAFGADVHHKGDEAIRRAQAKQHHDIVKLLRSVRQTMPLDGRDEPGLQGPGCTPGGASDARLSQPKVQGGLTAASDR